MATWTYQVTSAYYYTHCTLTGNALNVKNYLESKGFSQAAIIGIIANMEHESTINPGQQEHGYGGSPSRGYGLVQWTPGTKIIDYAATVSANWYDGDIQMDFLLINAPRSWSTGISVTWDEYKTLTDSNYATRVFFYNFERGTWHDDLYNYAAFWQDYLYGTTPPTPPDPPDPPTPPDPPGGDIDWLFLLALKLAKTYK